MLLLKFRNEHPLSHALYSPMETPSHWLSYTGLSILCVQPPQLATSETTTMKFDVIIFAMGSSRHAAAPYESGIY